MKIVMVDDDNKNNDKGLCASRIKMKVSFNDDDNDDDNDDNDLDIKTNLSPKQKYMSAEED